MLRMREVDTVMPGLSNPFRAGKGAFLAAAFAALASAAPAAAMTFSTIPVSTECTGSGCPRAVIASGEISAEAPGEFTRFLRQEMQMPGLHAVVFLNSPGGNVESALKLGTLFHAAGAAVVVGQPMLSSGKRKAMGALGVVPGHCASACVYALMGAKKRVVPSGARVGVHRMSAKMMALEPAGGGTRSERIFAGSPEIEALRSYVARVGGSQDLISLAESIPHDQIRVLSPAEVRRYRLGTPKL
jgi:hypothetical protein